MSSFLDADYSAIEARITAWLAGQEDALQEYRDGVDRYSVMASVIYRVPPEKVNKHPQRFVGKQATLGCGFGMGPTKFRESVKKYGYTLPEGLEHVAVKAWRAKHPMTVKLWYGLERAACEASQNAGNTHRIGRLAVQRDGAWLRLRLPSGRYLCYAAPQVEDDKLSHAGINQYTRRWERLKTYGGKLVENATQAASRDVLMYGLRLAEDAGYKVVLRVHDELICEVPDDPAFSAEGLSAIMSTNPPWAEGLPLAAAGFECKRYRKGD